MGEYNGKANGSGTYFVSNGDKYVGEWKDSQRDGHGTYNFRMAMNMWVSESPSNARKGIYTYADGDVEEGVWKNNEFQYAKKLKQKASQNIIFNE